jgi:hypothetical protein
MTGAIGNWYKTAGFRPPFVDARVKPGHDELFASIIQEAPQLP